MIITDLRGYNLSGASDTLVRNLLARLNAAYPVFNGMWAIDVNEAGGTIEVTNDMLSKKWGFLMHVNKIDPEGRKVVRAAGELLERYRVSRSNNASVVIDSLAQPRDFRGELVPDHG